ncbi:MAG: GntR family transcriptional regulator [Ramlibacter sp.]
METQDPSAAAPTVSEQAFLSLRRDVLHGEHPPGAKLKLELLQVQYGFSSSPLREALNRLAQEGLVRADERRGFRVAPVSAEDMADITRMRLMIDVSALRDAITAGDDSWEAALVASFHRLERLEARLTEGPVILDAEWVQRHREFHMALVAACPSQRQLALSASLFDQAERYRQISGRYRQGLRRKNDEHRRLMQAALKRDAGTACALLADHIEGTQRNVAAALKKMQDGQGA